MISAKDAIKNLSHMIFDIDGTLLDSMDIWCKVDELFLVKKGLQVPHYYANEVSKRSAMEGALYTKQLFGLPETAEEIVNEWRQMSLAEYPNVKTKPYAKEFLTWLKERGVKLAVATALTKELLEFALKTHGLYGFFDEFCSTDEVPRGKMFPDVFLLALKKLNADPQKTAIFEDVFHAVKSAKQTGCTVFAIKDNFSLPFEEQIKEHADYYIDSYLELI
jgi:HAD superfamily hydrolase (TIGR01509 family)